MCFYTLLGWSPDLGTYYCILSFYFLEQGSVYIEFKTSGFIIVLCSDCTSGLILNKFYLSLWIFVLIYHPYLRLPFFDNNSLTEEERWSNLMSSLNNLTHNVSHNKLCEEIRDSNKRVDTSSSKTSDLQIKVSQMESSLSPIERQNRVKNIVLYKLEDSGKINSNWILTIMTIFKEVNLPIPEVVIDDVIECIRSSITALF